MCLVFFWDWNLQKVHTADFSQHMPTSGWLMAFIRSNLFLDYLPTKADECNLSRFVVGVFRLVEDLPSKADEHLLPEAIGFRAPMTRPRPFFYPFETGFAT